MAPIVVQNSSLLPVSSSDKESSKRQQSRSNNTDDENSVDQPTGTSLLVMIFLKDDYSRFHKIAIIFFFLVLSFFQWLVLFGNASGLKTP